LGLGSERGLDSQMPISMGPPAGGTCKQQDRPNVHSRRTATRGAVQQRPTKRLKCPQLAPFQNPNTNAPRREPSTRLLRRDGVLAVVVGRRAGRPPRAAQEMAGKHAPPGQSFVVASAFRRRDVYSCVQGGVSALVWAHCGRVCVCL
jgi:hypothetical protein